MMQSGNDNGYTGSSRAPAPDAHGQAALLLVESLIFGLIDRSAINVDDAIGIVDVATDVIADKAADLGETPETVQRSLSLLSAIGTSFRRA